MRHHFLQHGFCREGLLKRKSEWPTLFLDSLLDTDVVDDRRGLPVEKFRYRIATLPVLLVPHVGQSQLFRGHLLPPEFGIEGGTLPICEIDRAAHWIGLDVRVLQARWTDKTSLTRATNDYQAT